MNLEKLLPIFSKCRHLNIIKDIIKNETTSFSSINIKNLQKGYLNFYNNDSIQPFVPIAASGPWIATSEKKIIYDSGGYGMLGLGHNPENILNSLSKPQTMANIMTPNFNQKIFRDQIDKDISPSYQKIVCLNSGSEANTVAMRIANIHKNKNPVQVSLLGSFHGRTEMPAIVSESCREIYNEYLMDYSIPKTNYFVEPNNIDDLIDTFNIIKENNQFPELTIIEPVMGEGNPGQAINPLFYSKIRDLTKETGGLLLVDSVQAGFRCTGELSIMKYNGFENMMPPDMETFSKAINAGQFPFSFIALNNKTADKYKIGLYGNTMTTNPRALDVSTAVFKEMNQDVRRNIVNSGIKIKDTFTGLKNKYKFIENITGTGLLLAIHLNKNIDVMKVERNLRNAGLNVIHGGKNALRFTPWFLINDNEINLIKELLDNEFSKW